MTDDDSRTVADALKSVRDAANAADLDLAVDAAIDRAEADDSRTVADALIQAPASGNAVDAVLNCHNLGIDPDMSYDQFRRRLEMGERAEKCPDNDPDHPGKIVGPDYACGWDACLDHIRGTGA